MTVTKEKYPTWIFRNFKNFLRAFHYEDGFDCFLSAYYIQRSITLCHAKIALSKCDNTITITNLKTGRTGTAKCHEEDDFDVVTGIAIAWARYCAKDEQQLEDINKTIAQLNYIRLDSVPLQTYVCTVSEQAYFIIGANPLKTDYIIGIDSRSGLPMNLPKNLAVRIL